jgi:hypothetical protein
MKMPLDDHDLAQQSKAMKNLEKRKTRDASDEVAQDAAATHGPEAADFLSKSEIDVTTERAPMREEDLASAPNTEQV